jgi:GT2 family glycosyltransferase
MSTKPLISLIVTIDFKDKLEDFLKPFRDPAIGRAGYQIVVAEDIGWKYPFVKKEEKILLDNGCEVEILRFKRTGRAKKRNECIKKAKADILLLFAGDFVPLTDSIQSHILFHTLHPEISKVGVGSNIFIKEKRTSFMEWLEETGALFGVPFLQYKEEHPIDFFYGANTSVKKEFIRQSGLFDERFLYDACEDYDMGLRLKALGMQSYILPSATVIHQHDVTIDQRVMLLEMAGQSTVLLDLKYPSNQNWLADRTVSIGELEQEADDNKKKYEYSKEIRYLHKYYELISRIAFCKGYQKELKKVGF